jgi:hypothetical protein
MRLWRSDGFRSTSKQPTATSNATYLASVGPVSFGLVVHNFGTLISISIS